MKTFTFFALSLIFCMSCNNTMKLSNNSSTPEEKWAIIQDYMAPFATVSNERPMPDILSEQEVLIKAVEYAARIGALDSSYYVYKDNPELLNARIETPILLFFPDGTPVSYFLTVVDDIGETLMDAFVRPGIDVDYDLFETSRSGMISNKPDYLSGHYITKREAVDLIQSQFPDSIVSDPIAVRNLFLEGNPHSNNSIFWYFTVTSNDRSIETTFEEYIIDSIIMGFKMILGGVSGRSAISTGNGGSPYLGYARMAKLDTPLHILDKMDSARALGSVLHQDYLNVNNPENPTKYTPFLLQ
jgi:hypothetical protein